MTNEGLKYNSFSVSYMPAGNYCICSENDILKLGYSGNFRIISRTHP